MEATIACFLEGSKEKINKKHNSTFGRAHLALLPSTTCLLLQVVLGSLQAKMVSARREAIVPWVGPSCGETMMVPGGQGEWR